LHRSASLAVKICTAPVMLKENTPAIIGKF
jgi:hypothetical protein